ncbi:MAG: protein-L-isoaspartate(D-aspartate) O-methyltransferase [Chitinophagaceae bacterium]
MIQYQDTYRHKGLRKKLLDIVKEKGIKDKLVLDAMMNIPRHFFMDSALDNIAYEDRAFPIAAGQTISQPYTVAYQTELLQVKPKEKILEIGTGSTYQATVLAEMKAEVYTIERQPVLFEKNQHYIFKTRYPNIRFYFGDGFAGLPHEAPFDKILVTAAAPYIPTALLQQLRPGGFLVIPVDEGDAQRMIRLTKHADGTTEEEIFDLFRFVPMVEGK